MPKIRVQLGNRTQEFTVPKGTTEKDAVAYGEKIIAQYEKDAANGLFDPTSDSDFENFLAGVGRGVVNIGRNIANITGFKSDEEMEQHKIDDAALMDTKAGMAGSLVGEITATLPAAGVAGTVVKGASSLSKAARAPQILTKALASTPATMAVDGAIVGSLVADPNERGEGATEGALLSGSIGTAGKLFKKSLGKRWIPKSKEAMRTERMIGQDIPLSQSGKGTGKLVYSGIVANMPGSARSIRNQHKRALENWREFVVEEALPPGSDRVFRVGDDTQKVLGKLMQKWDTAFDDLPFKELDMKLSMSDTWRVPNFWDELKPRGAQSLNNVNEMTGQQLLTLKRDITNVMGSLDQKDWRVLSELSKFSDEIDNVIRMNVNPTGKASGELAKSWNKYENLLDSYHKYQDVVVSASRSLDDASRFKPKTLLKATNERVGKKGIAGEGPFNDIAKNATEAMEEFPSREGIFQLAAATGFGSGLMGIPGAMPATIAALGTSKVLSRPSTQKYLAGENPSVRRLYKTLHRKKKLINKTLPYVTRGVTIPYVEDQ